MKKIIYSIIICLLAIISVIFAIIDISNGLSRELHMIDSIIYIIFVIDYITRLILSDDRKNFFSENIFDLISIIPLNSAFRIFRTFKILKLTKLFKFIRFFSVSGRLLNTFKKFLDTNGFKYVLLLSSSLVIIGGFLISYFESMSFFDGIWWAFVTATTVGYGDLYPSTPIGRIIACVLMLSGIGLIGALTSTITSFFMQNSQNTISNDKVQMVYTLYNQLNDAEKELFKESI